MTVKLTFHLQDTEYDCVLHIRDKKGTRAFRMTDNATLGTAVVNCLTVEVTGDTCEVVALPKSIEKMKEEIRDFKGESFVETLVAKAVGKMVYAVYRDAILHTALTYRIPLRERLGAEVGGSDAVHLHLTERLYCPTPDWMTDFLELYPLTYVYFELSEGEEPFAVAEARALNNLEALRFARKITLLQCAGWGLLLYPFLFSRIKKLTKPRVILRKLKKLYRLPPEKRSERFMEDGDPAVLGKL